MATEHWNLHPEISIRKDQGLGTMKSFPKKFKDNFTRIEIIRIIISVVHSLEIQHFHCVESDDHFKAALFNCIALKVDLNLDQIWIQPRKCSAWEFLIILKSWSFHHFIRSWNFKFKRKIPIAMKNRLTVLEKYFRSTFLWVKIQVFKVILSTWGFWGSTVRQNPHQFKWIVGGNSIQFSTCVLNSF